MKGSLYNKLAKKSSKEVDLQNRSENSNKLLITINVLGSSGPLRFVVKENDLVCEVIHTALKTYARAARLPLLGHDTTNFLLYCPNIEEPYECNFLISLNF